MKCGLLALMLSAFAVSALADDAAPDKSDYTLLNPTPDADLRSFNTDRPPKANSCGPQKSNQAFHRGDDANWEVDGRDW
jgi:hypothetical protein